MRFTLYLIGYEYNLCEDPYNCLKNTNYTLLHDCITTLICSFKIKAFKYYYGLKW